jgi:hypothetical protein
MQRALIASGVLGLGTALVFGAAALTATLFPNGSTVPGGAMPVWARDDVQMGGWAKPMPMPAPGVMMEPPVIRTEDGAVELTVDDLPAVNR